MPMSVSISIYLPEQEPRIIHFQLFGAIYMASAVGAITAEREQVGYWALNPIPT